MDFTIKTYKQLLEALIRQDYSFQTFAEYLENQKPQAIILRHDVDARPENSLQFACIQHELGIKGSYYFRMVPQSYNEDIIREISSLGHEIGYHYETMDSCHGDVIKALEEFAHNLEQLRLLAPVNTICMHGSPLSKYDNRDLWRGREAGRQGSREAGKLTKSPSLQAPKPPSPQAHYSDFGIIGEPYFDIDFTKVFYLTDTGRRWDGEKVSVRDKVGGRQSAVGSRNLEPGTWNLELKFHSTSDIITAAGTGLLPDQIMFTFHPQRWTNQPLQWIRELVMQNVKNVVKRVVVSR